ncbi:MAG: FkbM family methyltransferase [Bacteroidota bacterium]|nr:FkbM family methyltransferase [Bacteroidota bacterium]
MIRKIKRNVRRVLGIKNDTDYYSQAGEDAILSKTFSFLLPVKNGFYVDIGSYHPFRHSNTYLLYKAGWRGVNIDPRPGSKALFDRYRGRDINIEAGIGGEDASMTYYMLDENSVMNTFSKDNLVKLGVFGQVKKTVEVPVFTFATLLEKYPDIKTIDYLNIDAEGFEMEILAGMNLDAVMPKVISIEQNDVLSFPEVLHSTAGIFLAEKGYTAYAKNILLSNVCTVFYIRNEYLPVNKY